MKPYIRKSGQVSQGGKYDIDLVGVDRKMGPYGFVHGMRIFVNDGNEYRPQEKERIKPGQRVHASVTQIGGNYANAVVENRLGSFIGDLRQIRLTGQHIHDARNAVSSPNYGGGISGVFTTVKRVKPVRGHDGNYQECEVVITELSMTKGGKPHIITRLADQRGERPINKEVFLLEWPPDIDYHIPYSKPSENSLPRFRSLRGYKIGIPDSAHKLLFFRHDNKYILQERRAPRDISKFNPAEAVEYYYNIFSGGRFRLAVATPDKIGTMMGAIEESGLYSEYLPYLPQTDK